MVLQLTVFWYIGAMLGHVCLGLGVLALGTMLLSWVFFFPQWGLGVCVVLWSVGCKSIQFLVHSTQHDYEQIGRKNKTPLRAKLCLIGLMTLRSPLEEEQNSPSKYPTTSSVPWLPQLRCCPVWMPCLSCQPRWRRFFHVVATLRAVHMRMAWFPTPPASARVPRVAFS